MRDPSNTTPEQIYGSNNLPTIKMVTLAPEISYGTTSLIESLTKDHNIRVSLGHSAASFEDGLTAVSSGATALTHTFNAMEPLNHRSPGLVGLISNAGGGCGIKTPYYSLIADTIHLHYAALVLAFRADPTKCILITDNVELAGLPDGVYPGHAQIPHKQRKVGNKVVIDGTDTLIGSCIGLDECVRNLAHFNGRGNSLAEAVRCVTENVAALMDLTDRGVVEEGRRADFVVLDNAGVVQSVWRAGRKVYEKLRGKGSAEVS
jgi:N-acetylglucosamine-6-phosphate deacetylase